MKNDPVLKHTFLIGAWLLTLTSCSMLGLGSQTPPPPAEEYVVPPTPPAAKEPSREPAEKPMDAKQEEVQGMSEEMQQRWALRVQSLQADAISALNRGKAFLAEKKYDMAAQEFHVVLNHIRWSPLKADWGGMEQEAKSLLTQAERARDSETESMRRKQEGETFQKLKEAEIQETARRKELLKTLISNAIDAYDANDFDECVKICDRALSLEPSSAEVRELREAAFKSLLDQSKRDYISKKKEEFQRWKENLAEIQVPYTDFMTLPDREYWEEITKKRTKRTGTFLTSGDSVEVKRLKEAIRTTYIPSLNVKDEAELATVVGILQAYTGLPIIVDPAASDAVRSGSIVFNLPIENPISVKDALDIIVDRTGGQIAYVFKHDAILVTTAEKAKGKSVVRNHDIQDLVFALTDFHGPNLTTLAEATSGGGKGGKGGESPFGSAAPEPQKIVNPEELVTLIKETIAPGTWDQEGHKIDPYGGNLIVVHSEEVHKQIEDFLNDLRKFTSAIVTIEAKFMTVSDNFLQEIGVEFRGLGGSGLGNLANLDDVTNGLEDNSSLGFDNGGGGIGSGTAAADNPASGLFYKKGKQDIRGRTENIFDNSLGSALSTTGGGTFQISILDDAQLNLLIRMIEKNASFQVVNSNTLSAHNGQRAYVTVVNQTSYISDYDVEVATAAFIADPKISIIPDGISLDVRPIIHQDRKYITLELQPTVATLIRPIQEFQTTLAGITNSVTIQLPELQVSSAFTTAVVPDGGSLLIGGLRKIRNVERKSEIPWLSKIPLLGVLGRTQGIDEENQSVLVLIRAYITDVKEEAKKIAAR